MVTHEMCLFSIVSENARLAIQWKQKIMNTISHQFCVKRNLPGKFHDSVKLLKCTKHYEGKFQHTPLDFSYSYCCTSMITRLMHHYRESFT